MSALYFLKVEEIVAGDPVEFAEEISMAVERARIQKDIQMLSTFKAVGESLFLFVVAGKVDTLQTELHYSKSRNNFKFTCSPLCLFKNFSSHLTKEESLERNESVSSFTGITPTAQSSFQQRYLYWVNVEFNNQDLHVLEDRLMQWQNPKQKFKSKRDKFASMSDLRMVTIYPFRVVGERRAFIIIDDPTEEKMEAILEALRDAKCTNKAVIEV